jgi:hypothetical protein
MKSLSITLLACLMICIAGCTSIPHQLTRGLRSVKPPKGSAISYAYLPAGTTLLPSKMNHTSAYQITNSCYAVFIDEQPKCDLLHGLNLLLVADDGTITTLFHGSGYPDFLFRRMDGGRIHLEWKGY